MRCSETENITVPAIEMSELGFADTDGVRQHRLKDRLQFAWRRADDAQHICRGCLLFQRLAQFVQKPRVLNSYNCLGGEVLHERDLLFCKCLRLLSIDRDCT